MPYITINDNDKTFTTNDIQTAKALNALIPEPFLKKGKVTPFPNLSQ